MDIQSVCEYLKNHHLLSIATNLLGNMELRNKGIAQTFLETWIIYSLVAHIMLLFLRILP